MELIASSQTWQNLVLTLFIALIVAAASFKKSRSRKAATLPPGPWRLPIIGNIHNLSGSKVPHQRLAELSRKHGPLMHLQLGQTSMVVVSSPDVARAIVKTHDLNFADRPALLAARELTNNCRDVGFAPYGLYWRTMKKIFVLELLTAKRVAAFRHIRETAVSRLLQKVEQGGTAPVNLSKLLYIVGNWTVSQVTVGRINDEQQLNDVVQVIDELVALASGMSLADLFPTFESIISAVTGMKRKIRQVSSKMDRVLDDILNKHMSRPSEASNVDEQKDDDQDILDLLLRHYRLQDLDFPLSLKDVKTLVWDLFIGGTDTSSSTLEWAMAELMRHPDVMLKAQSEVRRIYKEKGKMDESVVDELHYLKLVVKETLRLHPPLPLLLPRQGRETCEIEGYQIPAKTRVIINVWAWARDPQYWAKPNDFDPDRFRDRSLDFKGVETEYLPFGGGRRICPGTTFALAIIDITLAKLLCHFDWRLPGGMAPQDLNMEETSGATIRKKVPLCLVASSSVPI